MHISICFVFIYLYVRCVFGPRHIWSGRWATDSANPRAFPARKCDDANCFDIQKEIGIFGREEVPNGQLFAQKRGYEATIIKTFGDTFL